MVNCRIEENYFGVTMPWLLSEIKKRSKLDPIEVQIKNNAATKLQAVVRGFLVRQQMKILHSNATIIQKYWRRYAARLTYVRLLVEKNIMELLENRENAVIKIQKIWRGYWSRKTCHDQLKKTSFQKSLLMDLIICVHHKFLSNLKNNLNTTELYIKNSHCQKKLRKFKESLQFKKFNRKTLKRYQDNEDKIEAAEKYVRENRRKAKIPYGFDCTVEPNEKCLFSSEEFE